MLTTKGQGASPGKATGPLALSAQAAADLAAKGTAPIYVRNEMDTEDMPAIRAAAGVVIVRGGITGDGAVAARVLGKPCIVGCSALIATATELRCGKDKLLPGATLTIDGATGEISGS